MENKSVDEKINMYIVNELVWNSSVNAANVKVRVDDHIVTLSGTVTSYLEKLIVKELVRSIPGVYSIDDTINVLDVSFIALPSDEKIKEGAQLKLFWDPLIDTSNITIEVLNGIITLEGKVDAYWKKMRAEKQIAELKWVKDIVNNLVIIPTQIKTDEYIGQSISTELGRQGEIIDTKDVHISVKSGVVTIAGTVSDYATWEKVNKTAFFTVGIKDVKDRLKITW